MTGAPQPGSVRSRVLRVFTLYTHVDAPLLARAFREPTSVITGILHSYAQVSAVPGHTVRRPAVRVLYTLNPPEATP